MNKDTDNLTTRPENPFKVPEGYFESLTERVMARIPANEVRMVPEKKKSPIRWRPYAAAAAIVAVLFGVGAYIHKAEVEAPMPAEKSLAVKTSAVKAHADDSDFEAVADYIMCDDYDLYAYISNE